MPMSFLSFLFGRNKKSARVAKERLQLVLAAERSTRPARRPDYLPAMQRELLLVVSKYVKIQPKDIKVSVLHHRHGEVLEVKIDLPQAVRA